MSYKPGRRFGAIQVTTAVGHVVNPRRGGIAERDFVAGLRIVAITCLALCLIESADARAENAIDGITGATTSNETCARYGHPRGSDRALGASHHSTGSGLNNDKFAADIPIWKTMTLGTYDSANALREALEAARCSVGNLATEALQRPEFTISKSRTKVNLAVLSVADFGVGTEGASRAEVYRRAAQLGLELCPAEVGPQLRLQYVDQPLGEFLHIAMEPVATDGGDLVGLIVGNGGAGLFLVGGDVHPDRIVPPTLRLVFVRQPVARLPTTAIAPHHLSAP